MMSTTNLRALLQTLLAVLLLTSCALAQGIKTKRGAVVLYGSVASCSQPATINYKKVQRATPEWKEIKSDGVRKGTARYDLLISAMNTRIKSAVQSAAQSESRDCVVRKGDIKDKGGLDVADLTDAVITEVES